MGFLRRYRGEIISIVVIIILFLALSYLTQLYSDEITGFMGQYTYLGAIGFFLFVSVSVVLAPVSSIPLIPVASNLWGWYLAAVIIMGGEILGAYVSFFLSRRYGQPLIKKLVSLKEVQSLERRFSREFSFWGVVAVRLLIPFDVVNYAFGLFTSVKTFIFLVGTFISLLPYVLVTAYLGTLPFVYQVMGIGIGFALSTAFLIYLYLSGKLNF